ncbi:MAG: hypothetical protein J6R96_08775, partial [Spirochaetaceae bacterium]|nr:hypothetical protein [Spirochaetaceae bacterium]
KEKYEATQIPSHHHSPPYKIDAGKNPLVSLALAFCPLVLHGKVLQVGFCQHHSLLPAHKRIEN